MLTEDLPLFPFRSPGDNPFTPVTGTDLRHLDGPVTRVRLPTGGWTWLVTRHADVKQLLRSDAFSADMSSPNFPLLRPAPNGPRNRSGGFIRMDGDEHLRLRRMLTAEFMIKNIRRIEPLITDAVGSSLDALAAAGPPADLVEHFALPVPSLVICHLLGVPYADHAFFQQRSAILLDQSADPLKLRDAIGELRGYLADLIEARRQQPAEDLIGRLVTERVATGELDAEELIGMSLLLLIAGHETTANMIGLSTLLLLQHPEHLAALRDDEDLADGMVEELLRYLTIVRTGLPRLARRDVDVGGHTVRAGEPVTALLSLANRDDDVFAGGDDFDPYRQAQQHLAFGFGVHQCIGQPLARAELRIALVRLVRRFPGLALAADPAKLPQRDTSIVFGLAELPVTW
ncbi:cytochrome P450 [Actinoplanes friuliensis]|uniref:Cytochrome P450 monooxygenase CYP105B2 n=1 Tax=Actinoplanes friuliensis DSM 7358 TaxID=1246995 RepID=U5W0A0_9ACTN|nr:cytochrome P450 [Actinoplanes friuliensis]AGZ42539.1 cytochrome P450 monooxygenase CYP105B2 [Actinoplanes friuliensis DSM 7358]